MKPFAALQCTRLHSKLQCTLLHSKLQCTLLHSKLQCTRLHSNCSSFRCTLTSEMVLLSNNSAERSSGSTRQGLGHNQIPQFF